jgi:hypothetical protein
MYSRMTAVNVKAGQSPPEGFSLDKAAESGTFAGMTGGRTGFTASFSRFSVGDFFQNRENVRTFPRGSAGADFDRFGKAPALASRPPSASADGNEGENLGQTQQRILNNGSVHKNSPVSIFKKRIIGFSAFLFFGESGTTG